MNIGTMGHSVVVSWFLEEGSQVEGVTFSAVYTRPCSREQAEILAQTYHVPTIHHNVDAFLADPAIDTVYIALPNSLHYTYAKRALEAGKHVIMEKPFTPTRAQAVRLTALAREKQLFLLEAITVPHLPNVKQAQKLLPRLGGAVPGAVQLFPVLQPVRFAQRGAADQYL